MLNKEHIFVADTFSDTDQLYSEYAIFLKNRGLVTDSDKLKRLFIKRENVHSTAIGKGAAAPHIYSDMFSSFIFSVILLKKGLEYHAPDKETVHVVFVIMSDERVELHLKALSNIARLVDSTDIVEKIKKSGDAEEIYRIMSEFPWENL